MREITALAEAVGYNSQAAVLFQDESAASQTLKALRAEPLIVYAAVYRDDGALVAMYGRNGMGGSSLPDVPTAGERFIGRYLNVYRPMVVSRS